jgi:hypothetical protein
MATTPWNGTEVDGVVVTTGVVGFGTVVAGR